MESRLSYLMEGPAGINGLRGYSADLGQVGAMNMK
jgi:hypothetical protein